LPHLGQLLKEAAVDGQIEIFLGVLVEIKAGDVGIRLVCNLTGRSGMKPFLGEEFLSDLEQPFFGGTAF